MRTSIFREGEFILMERYLQISEKAPLEELYRNYLQEGWYDRFAYPYHLQPNMVIIYLEDFAETEKEQYQLLLDFFTFSDYTRFVDVIGLGEGEDEKGYERPIQVMPRSTFIKINNYRSNDDLTKGGHYYLDIYSLRERISGLDSSKENDFPLLLEITLRNEDNDEQGRYATLLYQTYDLTYPQWVFRSLTRVNKPANIQDGDEAELIVWDVNQGNFDEVKVNGKPYAIFDAGTEVLDGTVSFYTLQRKLQRELDICNVPLFVLSHWHTDHYSLLFALNDDYLKKIDNYMLPRYVKNLSAFLFITRLNLLVTNVAMIVLPSRTAWVKYSLNSSLCVYANKYVHSNTNNSGLTFFVKGPVNNAMLTGDCRYRLAESEANDTIVAPMGEQQKHYLVIPHHGGLAGTVNYQLKNARKENVEGIVSVGINNSHKHPNAEVMKQVKSFVWSIEMTMDHGGRDVKKML